MELDTALPPESPRFAERQTVLLNEVAKMQQDTGSVTVERLLGVVRRMATDLCSLERVLSRIKLSSSAFDARCQSLAKTELGLGTRFDIVERAINGEYEVSICEDLKQCRNQIVELRNELRELQQLANARLPQQIADQHDFFNTRCNQLDSRVSELAASKEEMSAQIGEMVLLAAQTSEAVKKTESHMQWYKNVYTETEKQMNEFLNAIPTIQNMNKRMESYLANIESVAAHVATTKTDIESQIKDVVAKREVSERIITDRAYNHCQSIDDRLVILERQLRSDVATPAPAPSTSWVPVLNALCGDIVERNLVNGIVDVAIVSDQERTWSGVLSQIRQVSPVTIKLFETNTPFVAVVGEARSKCHSNWGFMAVFEYVSEINKRLALGATDVDLGIVAHLILAYDANERRQHVPPISPSKVRERVRDIEQLEAETKTFV